LCLTIGYGFCKYIYLLYEEPTESELESISDWIFYLIQIVRTKRKQPHDKSILVETWEDFQKEALSVANVQEILLRFNLKLSKNKVKRLLKAVGVHNKQKLEFTQFILLMKIIIRRPEIETIFGFSFIEI